MKSALAIVAALALYACSLVSAAGLAQDTLTLSASLTPNVLGAPTNLAASATLASSEGLPQPVSDFVVYVPAGLRVDVRGVATCQPVRLELDGPAGCPAQSRVGFGGGVGAFELAGAPVKEPYTLDLFLAPRERGRLAVLIYADAVAPVAVQLVLTAREVPAPKPYAFGLAVEVPPVPTVPGAGDASVESGYISLGGADVAYYKTIAGRRKLVHVQGVIAPASCPHSGFPFQAIATFADGTTSSATYASPCPTGRP
jgi:hypothetical protein